MTRIQYTYKSYTETALSNKASTIQYQSPELTIMVSMETGT